MCRGRHRRQRFQAVIPKSQPCTARLAGWGALEDLPSLRKVWTLWLAILSLSGCQTSIHTGNLPQHLDAELGACAEQGQAGSQACRPSSYDRHVEMGHGVGHEGTMQHMTKKEKDQGRVY